MDRFIKFMNESFAPRINKLTQNVWVSSIQDAIMTTLPLILVGSLVTLVSLLNEVFPGMPDFSPINMFSFGLLRSEEHTSELQSRGHLVCRLLLEKKKLI